MRIGVDVDGVLADFNSAFIHYCITATGRDLFPPRPFDIPCWDYPEHYGYTDTEVKTVWTSIKASPCFWRNLPMYANTMAALQCLNRRIEDGDDVYFIMARLGTNAKRQTEDWLKMLWPTYSFLTLPSLTVLMSSHKGLCVRALGLDVYVDDQWENVDDVARVHWKNGAPMCRTFLLDRPWNRHYLNTPPITRIQTLPEMF